jgi:hypothetical protein
MGLLTRTNPDTNELEIQFNNEWMSFNEYRENQINEAYDKSIVFLRNRLSRDDQSEQLTKEGTENG